MPRDDNDADMAIFLHGRHALLAVIFFCTTRGIFLQLTIKREYKRRILFPFIDHFHNLPIYLPGFISFFLQTPLLYCAIIFSHLVDEMWYRRTQSCSVVCFWKGERMPKQRKICPALIARLVLDNHSTGFVITSLDETGLLLTAAICQCHRHVLISW